MNEKTKGIVFKTVKYGESSAIVTIYTERFGLKSFLIKSLYSKSKTYKTSHFNYLSLVNIETNFKQSRKLHFIKEISFFLPLNGVRDSIVKSTLTMFFSEVLTKSIKEEEANSVLFDFLLNFIIELDKFNSSLQCVHLYFLTHLAKYLGFMPEIKKDNVNMFFDLQLGLFVKCKPLNNKYLDKYEIDIIYQLLYAKIENLKNFTFEKKLRNNLFEKLIIYYEIHIPSFGSLKSVKILTEIFD